MKNKKQLLGIVLCGGQSSRMGTDKALIKTHNQTWLDKSISLLLTLNIEVVLSVNSRQYPFYENTFSSIIIINDDKDIDVKGPLLGLLSVLRWPNFDGHEIPINLQSLWNRNNPKRGIASTMQTLKKKY
jgi:molybdopterin-guanine dinucleotide biosynthesis protein A